MSIVTDTFAALKSQSRTVVALFELRKNGSGKYDKKPCNNQLEVKDYMELIKPYHEALQDLQYMRQAYPHIRFDTGHVFLPEDRTAFLDLDSQRSPMATASEQYPHLDPWGWPCTQLAYAVFQWFPGCATEVSSSESGYHLVFRIDTGMVPSCKVKHIPGLECYVNRKKFMMYGRPDAIGDASLVFNNFPDFAKAFKLDEKTETGAPPASWDALVLRGPLPEWTPILDDNDIIQKMLSEQPSANTTFGDGISTKDLWEANETALLKTYPSDVHNNYDRSRADSALALKLGFYTGQDAERTERLMWLSKLRIDDGSRDEKWGRDYYLPLTITKAFNTLQGKVYIGGARNTTTSQGLGLIPIQKAQYVEIAENGKPANSIANLKQLLTYYGITVRWNDMSHIREVNIPNTTVHIGDAENACLCKIIDLCSYNNLPVTRIDEQLNVIAQEDTYHPIAECVSAKPWDGIPRMDQFISSLKTTNDIAAYPLIRTWIIATIAAAFSEYGFTQQGILVLEGPQGLEKTRWVKSLDPTQSNAVKEAMLLDLTNKDCIITAISHWIVEIGELDGTMRRTDIARIKGFSTSQVDVVRFPYARKNTRVYRRTSFIASVNEPRFLTDTTGNRRWWVISIQSINLNHGLDMQQVWAEAYHLWLRGEKPYLDKAQIDILNAANKRYEMVDPFEESLLSYFDWSEGWQNRPRLELTCTQVLKLLGYGQGSGKHEPTRMANILRKYTQNSGRERHYWLPTTRVSK